MSAKSKFVLIFSGCLFFSMAESVELISDDLSQLRARVISECRETNPTAMEGCISDAGLGVLAHDELLKYNDTSLMKLCAQTASQHLLPYLSCMKSQLKIKQSSPFAQYSSLILRTDQFRSSWVASCKAEYGLDVSACVKSKTADFYRFWEIYTGLAKKSSTQHSKFESCMSKQRSTEWSEFVNCYQN